MVNQGTEFDFFNRMDLTQVFKALRVGLWDINFTSHECFLNQVAVDILGLDTHECPISCDKILQTICPEDRSIVRNFIAHGQNERIGLEFRVIGSDGSRRMVRIQETEGSIETCDHITGIIQDITEQKQAEVQMRFVLDATKDGMIVVDDRGKIVKWNASAQKIFGYMADECIGDELSLIIPERFRAAHFQGFKHYLEVGEPKLIGNTVELVGLRKDGTEIPIELSLSTTDEGIGSYFIGIIRDISKRKRMHQKLQRSQEQYRQLIDNLLDVIGILDDGKWVFINPAGVRFFGAKSEAEIVGRRYDHFLHPDHHEEWLNRTKDMRAGKQVGVVEQKWIQVNGDIVHAEVTGIPFGETGVQMIMHDVTERKASEELIIQSEKLSAVGQLAAGVAHEIRNPLTALKGFLQLLQVESRENVKEYCDIMQNELNRIEMILSELLVLAKPQGMNFEPRKINVILKDVIALLETQAILNNVTIIQRFDMPVPVVLCEESRLKQVFVNIIKNAIEAMQNGGELEIRLEVRQDNVCIQFVDEGEGIPKEQISKLGNPFYTTKSQGTGLGLMLSKRIIEDHNGQIHITSEIGKGTCVSIVLPLA
ncbi:PAS domain S-box protein [Alicyclobacillus fodiniaquatilis]|uniref:histidine kinase n=1 Tax=Alicyclobacillus fodiniaquatilis TaxID=1661150 RepID=A0ABW4JMZ5_9BACL